jgi:hypothetical protein
MAVLPASSLWMHLSEQMEEIISLASALPRSVDHSSVQVALDSFFSEIDASQDALRQLGQLCTLSVVINENDGLLSDLLEHIDSFPSLPTEILASSYSPSLDVPPEEQLMERLQFIEGRIDNMHAALAAVSEFPVAISECERIQQTWRESIATSERATVYRKKQSTIPG